MNIETKIFLINLMFLLWSFIVNGFTYKQGKPFGNQDYICIFTGRLLIVLSILLPLTACIMIWNF